MEQDKKLDIKRYYREDYCIHEYAPNVHCSICDEQRTPEERRKVKLSGAKEEKIDGTG